MLFKLLSDNATQPTRSTQNSVGLDLYSVAVESITVPPNGGIRTIKTDLAMQPPPDTYAKIAPRSSLALKNNIHVIAGVIDPDYRGSIAI